MQLNNSHHNINHASWYRDLLLLALLVSCLFGFMLGSRPLNVPDEARYSEIPREMIVTGDYITPHLDGVKYFEKPPLVYWMQVASIKPFGLNNWAFRLPTALIAMLNCLIIYCAGRVLFDRRSALLSAMVLSTSLFYFAFAHVITLDMTLTVFLTGTLLSFIVATRYPPGTIRRNLVWSAYLFAALATLTKGLVGILLPGAIIFTWLLVFNEWRQLKSAYYFTGIPLYLLIAAPWHIAVQMKNPEFFHFYFIQQQFTRYLTNYADRVEPNWFFIPILILGLYPWVVFLAQAITAHLPRSWRTRSEQKEPLFLLIWAAVIFVFFSLSQSKLIPYILPTIPPLSLLIGNYLAKSPRSKGIQRGIIFLLPLPIVISIAALIALYFFTASNPALMKTEMWGMFIISISGACLAYWVNHWRGTIAACATIAIATVLNLLILMAVIPLFDMGSILPLTTILQPRLKPSDEVVTYHNYYQDLPLYLQRRVTIVDWQNELTFGMEHQDTKQWMIDDATFWQRWQSSQTLYMIATQKIYHLQLLLLHKNETMHLLGQTEHDVLLTNH